MRLRLNDSAAQMPNMPEPLKHIVVLGGDACAPSVAAYVAHSLRGTGARVTLVDDMQQNGGISSTLPRTTAFCKALPIDDSALVAGISATFKLAAEYSGWRREDLKFVHSYGTHGVPIRLLPFHQYFINARRLDDTIDFEDYSLASAAALAGRFAYPSSDPASLLATLKYGLHVDTARFAMGFLRFAKSIGVEHVSSMVRDAKLDAESGFIASVTLDDGTAIIGDFFIDCSGARAFLIEEMLGVRYLDQSDTLPCNRRVSVSIDNVVDASPITRIVGKTNGWSRRVQLLERADFEYFYNSGICGDEEAATQLGRDTGATSKPEHRPVRNGRRAEFWRGNCVAIGRSAGELEPLGVSALSTAHGAVMRLMSIWPYSDCDPVIAREYNRLSTTEFEQSLDFVRLFYALSDRDDTDFWKHCQSLRMPETLEYRLSLFRSRGRLSWDAGDIFGRNDWLSVLLGFDFLPRDCDPLVDIADPELVGQLMAQLRDVLKETLAQMPRHDDFLSQLRKPSART
jgi:tryptophan halogenase